MLLVLSSFFFPPPELHNNQHMGMIYNMKSRAGSIFSFFLIILSPEYTQSCVYEFGPPKMIFLERLLHYTLPKTARNPVPKVFLSPNNYAHTCNRS